MNWCMVKHRAQYELKSDTVQLIWSILFKNNNMGIDLHFICCSKAEAAGCFTGCDCGVYRYSLQVLVKVPEHEERLRLSFSRFCSFPVWLCAPSKKIDVHKTNFKIWRRRLEILFGLWRNCNIDFAACQPLIALLQDKAGENCQALKSGTHVGWYFTARRCSLFHQITSL